jgi:signal transduction histidine kinase
LPGEKLRTVFVLFGGLLMNSPLDLYPAETLADPAELCRRLVGAEQLLDCLQQALGHELPNHLVAFQGLVHILELDEGMHLGAAGRDYLRRLSGITQRVHAQVSMLAEICRARRDTHPAESLVVQEVAREAAAEVKQLFSGRPMEYHFTEPALHVHVPRPALRRVLFQLIRNAVQAAPEHRPAWVEVGARVLTGCREFWVADHGRGLSPDLQRQLHQFFTGQTGPMPGAGLGLVLVRAFVSRWGGSLHVESGQGRGSTFTVSLPGANWGNGSTP